MKQSRKINLYNKVLSLLGFAAATACEPGTIGITIPGRVEYGCPYMDFVVSGKVVNKQSDPIPGIKVSSCGNSTFTDRDGAFSISGQDMSPQLFFEDIDGQENGGEFAFKMEEIEAEKVGDGDGRWYMGKYQATDVVVEMEEKE